MAIRAENDPRFSRRFLFMGLAAIGFALWSAYDGAIKYPREQQRALAWEKDFSDQPKESWIKFAEERGWSTSIPHESKSEEDHHASIWMQWAQFVVAGLIGLASLAESHAVSASSRARTRPPRSRDRAWARAGSRR